MIRLVRQRQPHDLARPDPRRNQPPRQTPGRRPDLRIAAPRPARDRPVPRQTRAIAAASASARSRPGAPSSATFARPSVSITSTGVSPRDRARKAVSAASFSAPANGVPPPPGSPESRRFVCTKDRVGGSISSAPAPRKEISAT